MALLDIFKGKKRKEDKLKRPPRGALKRPAVAKVMAGEPDSAEKIEKPGTKEKSSELACFALRFPHITEKTAILGEKGVYAFKVSPRANKVIVARAVFELYGFKPKKVRILNMPEKVRIVRGKAGTKSGYKKALVYLKEGDKIELG